MGIRSIEFRGKRQKNGEWVYGDLLQIPKHELYSIMHEKEDTGNFIVDKNTIGQYTGLTDKNGTKIFEGDIVKLTDDFVNFETYAVVEFGNPNGLYNWGWQLRPLENKPFAVEILHWVDMEESGAYIEVIGNIYDNPELLRGEGK